MEVREVITKKERQQFHQLPIKLYRSDSNYICPLQVEIERLFHPSTNKLLHDGDCKRWLLYEGNLPTGRIAAFYNRQIASQYKHPTGGIGFFECTDSTKGAALLFDTAKDWLTNNGLQAMLGPVNFGENYQHWGLLVDGFMPQGYGMPYNHNYYQKLFENYGFRNYFTQYSYHKNLAEWFPERMIKFAKYVASRPGHSFEHFRFATADKYIDDFLQVYNSVWSSYHEYYDRLLPDDLQDLIINAKPLIDEELIWFAYDNGKPVGLTVLFPDINQLLAHLKNGKLHLFNKLKLFYYRKRVIDRARALIAGVMPEHQNSGMVAAMFLQVAEVLRKKKYRELELSWVGDYNPKMLSVYESIGGKKAKTHITYLYNFNPQLPFERFTNEFDGKKY